jgi:hypothetical protein
VNLYTGIKAVLLGRGFSPPLRSAQFFGKNCPHIVRRQDATFNSSDRVVGDRFLINPGFGTVTYSFAGMAAHSQLAEPDLDRAMYCLVLDRLAISQCLAPLVRCSMPHALYCIGIAG